MSFDPSVTASNIRIFLIAGEHSGDQLGGKLMPAVMAASEREISFSGLGGDAMAAQGLKPIFPLSDVAVMGSASIAKRLPTLVRRVYQTVDAAIAANPHVVVIIDSPEFTHPIAKRIRKRVPEIPIIDYVSPSVWAWRPGRAKRMKSYIDHVLALLPFEPAAHERLGGPPCSYVGHPLIERFEEIRNADGKALAAKLGLEAGLPVLVVLPGSRPNEVQRLMAPFRDAASLLTERFGPYEIIIPAIESVRHLIEAELTGWPRRPHLIAGEADKFAAFQLGRAALAASGTVTLELALAGVPMVVGYRVDAFTGFFRWLVKVPSVVLANLILGENVFPEFIQEDCTPEKLAEALYPLMTDSAIRDGQLEGLRKIDAKMRLAEGSPSETAAKIIMGYVKLNGHD